MRKSSACAPFFSRDGFTDGYLAGKKGENMFGARDEQSAREARAVYQQAQSIYKSEPEPPCVPVDMAFSARRGQPVSLRVCDGDGFEYQSQALPAEAARTPRHHGGRSRKRPAQNGRHRV